jgi:hypothetical protein
MKKIYINDPRAEVVNLKANEYRVCTTGEQVINCIHGKINQIVCMELNFGLIGLAAEHKYAVVFAKIIML